MNVWVTVTVTVRVSVSVSVRLRLRVHVWVRFWVGMVLVIVRMTLQEAWHQCECMSHLDF